MGAATNKLTQGDVTHVHKPPQVVDMERLVCEEVASLVGLSIDGVKRDQPLMAMGLDSSSSVQLTSRLEEQLQVQLPGTLAFDYPSAAELAAHLRTLLPRQQPTTASGALRPSHPAYPASPWSATQNATFSTAHDDERAALPMQQHVRNTTVPASAADMRSAATFSGSTIPQPVVHVDVEALVAEEVADLLGESTGNIGRDEPLMAMGLDSSSSVQLTSRLEARLGCQLPGTLAFDYPTLAELTGYLSQLGGHAVLDTGCQTAAQQDRCGQADALSHAPARQVLACVSCREDTCEVQAAVW